MRYSTSVAVVAVSGYQFTGVNALTFDKLFGRFEVCVEICLLYTSDAADE